MGNFYFNIYACPFLASSVLFLLFGAYILRQSPRSSLHRSFFGISLSLSLWLGFIALMFSNTDPAWVTFAYRGLYLGVSFISVSVFTYSSIWLGYYEKQKYWIRLGYLLGVIFTALIWFTPWIVRGHAVFPWGQYSLLTVWGGGIYLAFFAFYMFALFWNFLRSHRQTRDPILKKQTRIVLIGFGIAYCGSVDFLPCYGINVFPIGAFSTMILVCTLAYTIIRYKLMDIETVIHKTIMWATVTVIAVVPFAFIGYWSHGLFSSLTPLAFTAYFLFLLLSFYFYFRAIQPRLDQLFRRHQANLQGILNRFSEEIVHLKNLDDLFSRFMRTLQDGLYLKQASVYLLDEAGEIFVPVRQFGYRDLKPIEAGHPFLTFLQGHDSVVIADLAAGDPAFQSVKEAMRDYFASTEALVLVPLALGEKMIGLVHLGKKENLKRYGRDEVYFISAIRAPFTIAVSNSRQYENVSRLYEQVQDQNRRLKELDRLKSEFLANTSHELRTPLNGILGLVEAIVDGSDGPLNRQQKRHLRMIIESGTNLKELINNLLELSRIESGRQKLSAKYFNILNVVDSVIALMEGLAQKKGLRLSRLAPAGVGDVFGDPEKIQRVLINLVGNAVKFTPKGSVTVKVSDEGERVCVSVEDTGVGIPEKERAHIFERFRQADGSVTRRYEGTGLGLSIAREIVQMHGGDIDVKSREGRGTIFVFSLPKKAFQTGLAAKEPGEPAEMSVVNAGEMAAETQEWAAARELEEDAEFQEGIRGSGERILIIDDNEVNREVVKTRLLMNNYRVMEAVDGVEGLQKVRELRPDLVILDLMMPRMSGYEFCKRLREQYEASEVPVIMLTAKTDMGDKIHGFSLGANDYISKPFHQEELMARVGVLLKIHRMTQELRRWNQELERRVEERTRELVNTQEQLIQAEKLATIGTLSGGVAHEINNPLTAVLTNAQILKMTASEEDRESIELIEEGAKRCQMIVQKLLKYSRKSDQEKLEGQVHLDRVLKNVAALLSYQLAQDNVTLELDLAADMAPVNGIANELEQVFTNLIVNARDAIRSAGQSGKIRITVRQDHDFIEAQVRDDGIGIKKEHLSKIFDPFFTTKDVGEGTGLGLAVTFSILEKHQCKISVDSEPNAGTTFKLRFPVSRSGVKAP